MNRISPVWILTSLKGEEFDKFKEAIDQQFKAFSETELNGFVDCQTHQWWGVDSTDGGLDEKWDRANGYPNNVPAYQPNKFHLYDGNYGIVLYYAPLFDFTKDSNIHINRLKRNPLFFQTYGGNKFFYGLTSFHKQETADGDFFRLIEDIQTKEQESNLFGSITFLSDTSHVVGVNPNGYQSMDLDDFRALIVNTIFSIAITKAKLHQLNSQQQRLFNTAGVFSFIYEPDALRKSKAYHLADQLMNDFCTNEQDSQWYCQNDANAHFESSSLKKNLHWNIVYKQLSQGFKEESIKGLYQKCDDISPWRMLAYKLVPSYFKRHVRSVLRKTYNNVHDFSSLTTMRYESFSQNKRKQMLKGTAEIDNKQQFARTAIGSYLSSVWDKQYKGAKGIKQVLSLLKKTRGYLVEQKEEVGRVESFTDPNDEKYKGFPKLEDYPLHEIDKKENKHIRKHYEELVTNGEPPAEYTKDADKSYEERLLSKLRTLLEWHAMPLNLFTKAGLLSVLIFVTVWSLIAIIQYTNKVHIFSLETDQSLIILFLTTAIIVLIFAFVKYGFKTLRKIRLTLQKYIAWSYYKVQREVYRLSLEEEKKYYDQLINECDRLKSQLDEFVTSQIENIPSFEQYNVSKFQRNILDKMDDGNDILNTAALNVELRIGGTAFSLDTIAPGLFDAVLMTNDNKLNEQMRECILRDTNDEEKRYLKEDLLQLWTNTLTEHIQVLIYGQYGDAVDFPAFHNSPTSNFTTSAWMSVNAIIYPSVYVYAMNPYSWSIAIVPNGNSHASGDRWEDLFHGSDAVCERVPNFANVQNPAGWLTTRQIALFLRIHAYDRLIVNGRDDSETTIFNNQFI